MGSEFTVNSYEQQWQDEPIVESFADGSFVIMWRSFFFDTDTYYVAAQRYDRFGTAIGGETVIDAVTGSASEVKDVTALRDGGFVVTFSYSPGGLLETDQTYAKVYNADFTVRKDAFKVEGKEPGDTISPSIGALANGGFIAFFGTQYTGTSVFDEVYARRYDKNGNALGASFKLNTKVKEFDQNLPDAIQLKNGNLLAFWHSEASITDGTDDGANQLRGTLFSKTGAIIKSDFGIEKLEGGAGDSPDPFAVDALKNGGFVLARYETVAHGGRDFTYDVKMKLFNSSGVATSKEITAFAATKGIIYAIDVTQLATGEIVVVWETPGPGNTFDYFNDVQARMFDASGRAITGVFNIAQNRFDDQEDPDIEALAGGGFVVTYLSEQADSDHDGISARIFGRGTAGNDNATVDATGSFWGFAGQDNVSGNAGQNRLYGGADSDRLNGLAGNDLLNGGTGADQFIFASALNTKTNVDKITDFKHAEDEIALLQSTFAKIGPTLSASELRFGTKAADGNDYLIYDKKTGSLYYDTNANATGGQTLFATLKAGTVIDIDDITLL